MRHDVKPTEKTFANRKSLLKHLKSIPAYNRILNWGGLLVKFELKDGTSFVYKISNDFADEDIIAASFGSGSDLQIDEVMTYTPNIKDLKFTVIEQTESIKKAGAFLNYLYTVNMPEYGIFDHFNIENYEDNCLVAAISNDVEPDLLNIVKTYLKGMLYVPANILKQISNVIKKSLTVHDYTTETNQVKVYGKTYSETIKLGLIEEHYFKYDNNAIKVLDTIRNKRLRQISPDEYSQIPTIEVQNYEPADPIPDFDYRNVA